MTVAAVVNKKTLTYSETFIRTPIEMLPGKVITATANSDTPQGQLKEFLLRQRVDVALIFYGTTATFALKDCRDVGIPFVVRFAGYDAFDERVLSRHRTEYKNVFEYASAIIGVSEPMRDQLLKLGAPSQRVYICPSGARLDLFYGATPSKSPPVFVAVGRLIDKKAPHLTLLAFQIVHRIYPEAKLEFVGDGPLLEVCRTLTNALGLRDVVSFSGVLTQSATADVMRRCRAVIQHSVRTSYGDCEGTPNAVMEAGATGLPVIGTKHGGIPAVVLHGETGLLVEEGDIERMAENVLLLCRSPELADRMGAAGHMRVVKYFSAENSIRRLWLILRRSVDRVMSSSN